MKVLAINSSSKMEESNTSVILLNSFLEGLKQAGAEVELFYTKRLNIKPCENDLCCWFKTPGKCFHKDDMQMLLHKMIKADILVFATAIITGGISAHMKNLLERTLPLVEPFFELRNGHCTHPIRYKETKVDKLVLISTCGFWEIDNFDPLVSYMKAYCKFVGIKFAGALLRTCGDYVKSTIEKNAISKDDTNETKKINNILEATKEAGRQLIKNELMSSDTLQTISCELISLERYLRLVNLKFQIKIEKMGRTS